ncbi:MAG: hypothetical protein LBM01_02655 [Christensenellaceae bacterium]|nr:hypothetical protein [Christensenellaceae bacterium]
MAETITMPQESKIENAFGSLKNIFKDSWPLCLTVLEGKQEFTKADIERMGIYVVNSICDKVSTEYKS